MTEWIMSNELQELAGTFRRLAWSATGEGRRFCIATVDVTDTESVSVKGDADPSEFIQGLEYRFWGKWGKAKPPYGKSFEFRQLKRSEPHSRVAVVGYLRQFATGIGPVYASQLWDAFGAEAVRVLRTDPVRAAAAIGIPLSKAKHASEALNTDGQNEDLRLELVQLLDGRGFSKSLIEIVIKKWGLSAPDRIRRDPFTLLVNRFPSCGFARCDRLYTDLGLPPERLKRQFACIWNALKSDGEGHTWHRADIAAKAVAEGVSGLPEGTLNWKRAATLGVRAGWLRKRVDSNGQYWIAEAKKADNEASVASDLRRLMGVNDESRNATSEFQGSDKRPCSVHVAGSGGRATGESDGVIGGDERCDHDLEKQCGHDSLRVFSPEESSEVGSIRDNEAGDRLDEGKLALAWPDPDTIEGLTPHQREQLHIAFRGRLAILTGDPGTGKTTAASLVLRSLRRSYGASRIAVACPSNMAAMRLRTVLNVPDIPVCTFQRLLGVQRNGHDGAGWNFFYNRSNKLPCDILFVDEDSMRDIDISAAFLEAIPDGAVVLFLGDTNQLPPVGHGAPLRDGIAAGVPRGHFTEILRNSGSITEFCKTARSGHEFKPPCIVDLGSTPSRNWRHFEASSPASQKQILAGLLSSMSRFEIGGRKIDPIRDSQIIVALNEKGDLSRQELNTLTQSVLNPDGIRVDGNPFRIGDKVIAQENCYLQLCGESDHDDPYVIDSDDDDDNKEFVSNGEIGIVLYVERKFSAVQLEGNRIVRVPVHRSESKPNGDFTLAYAVTFHKSQGSQWPIVFLLSDRAANRLGSRELWNTGGSRPQRLLVTIGELSTMQRQCQRNALSERKTFLTELILNGS